MGYSGRSVRRDPKAQAKDGTVTYGVRIHRGGGLYEWIGTFDRLGRVGEEGTAKWAEAHALARRSPAAKLTCGELADRYLQDRERAVKGSSLDRIGYALRVFRRDHEHTLVEALNAGMAEAFAAERNWAVDVLTDYPTLLHRPALAHCGQVLDRLVA